MSKFLKHTAALRGFDADKNPRRSLAILYGKIIRTLQKLPESYQYRQLTETLIRDRAKIVSSAKSVEEIEEKINAGEIKDLCFQAEKELKLLRNIQEWKCWEAPMNEVPINQLSWPPRI